MYPEQSGLVRRISQYFGPKQSKIASEEGLNEKLHKKQAIATKKKTNATISKINPKILSLVVGKFVFFFYLHGAVLCMGAGCYVTIACRFSQFNQYGRSVMEAFQKMFLYFNFVDLRK